MVSALAPPVALMCSPGSLVSPDRYATVRPVVRGHCAFPGVDGCLGAPGPTGPRSAGLPVYLTFGARSSLRKPSIHSTGMEPCLP